MNVLKILLINECFEDTFNFVSLILMVPGTHIEGFLSRMLHPPHFFKEGMPHSC